MTQGGESWVRTGLLIASGALLLGLAAVRLVPYVRTRLTALPVITSTLPELQTGAGLQPASFGGATASDGEPTREGADQPADLAQSGGGSGSELASVPLVPTPQAPPTRLVIPAISVDAPVEPIPQRQVNVDGASLALSRVPARYAAGWHNGSAGLGVPGNTVLNGHNTGYGEVFRDLYLLGEGDAIIVYSEDRPYVHKVSEIVIVREEGQSVEARRRNARYVEETGDERLTLVTCHPYGSLHYRLIVVAHPGISPADRQTRRAPQEG